ncbi:hypothetical protein, partial [Saccharopolyspora shandongensis]|uniref:hypothetical protein n=1 Tax=Saccharopolyspora shandongensis TaxID=418495 RepID=UPI00340A4785
MSSYHDKDHVHEFGREQDERVNRLPLSMALSLISDADRKFASVLESTSPTVDAVDAAVVALRIAGMTRLADWASAHTREDADDSGQSVTANLASLGAAVARVQVGQRQILDAIHEL